MPISPVEQCAVVSGSFWLSDRRPAGASREKWVSGSVSGDLKPSRMTERNSTATRAFALMALLAGCTQPPDRVFVPGSPFTHVIDVRTAEGATATVKVGEWVTLHARRRTGPWTEAV